MRLVKVEVTNENNLPSKYLLEMRCKEKSVSDSGNKNERMRGWRGELEGMEKVSNSRCHTHNWFQSLNRKSSNSTPMKGCYFQLE